MMNGMYDSAGGWTTGWFVVWGLLAVVLTVLAVVATVWLVARLGVRQEGHQESGTYLDVLNRRYAAGEIDRDEFLRRRDDLARR